MNKNIMQTDHWLMLAYRVMYEDSGEGVTEEALEQIIGIKTDNIQILKGFWDNSQNIVDYAIAANLFSKKEWNSYVAQRQDSGQKEASYYTDLIPAFMEIEIIDENNGQVTIEDLVTYVSLVTNDSTGDTTVEVGNIVVGDRSIDIEFRETVANALIELGTEWWSTAFGGSSNEEPGENDGPK